MQKTLRDYLSMTPAQILADPDAAESLKTKAQMALENESAAKARADRQVTS